ncbi:radical SAM family heme chaperone HemW [Alloprevotella tannerae]|uniref:radical SAM family heme chaperone HemW n=1 Tax=Alloprevotella tannerae TaxID=76122 RepID=UPI00288A2AD0|nr:radical SAM family heme chaperone HemW [Alloprevotella tannerae]
MAGLYVHVPFCASRCIYCDFYSTTQTTEQRERYTKALIDEIKARAGRWDDTFQTIYFGGGTPSQLSIAEVSHIITAIQTLLHISPSAEITFEANPDDINANYVKQLKSLGINRISLGVQTFDDARLHFLRRRHTAKEAAKAVETTSTIIENVSLDLIYGLPNQTLSDWETDIRQALQLPIKHLSSYALTIEEGTPLFQLQQKQIIKEVKEDITRAMYEMLMLQTEQAGMQHYEISNFAYPTYHSQHNHNYWLGLPYLGVGPGAHSYKGHTRRWNKSDLNHYLQHPGQPLFDFEQLNEDEHFNEMLLLRLRTKEGLSLNELKPQDRNYLFSVASPFIKQGYLHLLRETLYLSKHGIFISNYIISSLMKG